MKTKLILLTSLLAASLLTGCNTNKTNSFKLSFYQDEGNQMDVMTVEVGKTTQVDVDAFMKNIKINSRRGYDTEWRKFNFATLNADYLVTARYLLHEYKISFVCDDKEVGSSSYNILSKSIKAPDFNGDPGYTYTYEPFNFRNKAEDLIIPATKVEAQYSVTFKKSVDDLDPVVKYYTISHPEVVAPEGKTGYTAVWSNGRFSVPGGEGIYFSGVLQDFVFIGEFTAKTYTITYNPNGGTMSETTQTVTFDQPYTLFDVTPASSLEYIGWFDNEDQTVAKTGTWNYDHDLELKAKWGFSFEDGNVPSVFTGINRANLSVVDNEATIGTHALKIDIVSGNGNYKVQLLKTTLETLFADSTVVAVNFDAKANKVVSNFRSTHKENGTVSAWTYEENNNGYGLETNWKTFTFRRAYLDGYDTFFEGYMETGDYLFVDNIRTVTKELDGLGFESGALFDKAYKDSGHANDKPAPKQVFSALGNPSSVVKTINISYDVKSEGLRSFHVTKQNSGDNYLAMYLSVAVKTELGDDGYITFDLYTSIPVKSNPSNKLMVDGRSTGSSATSAQPLGTGNYEHPANTWVTYKIEAYKMTTDGRFLQIQGSTAGEYYFDNIILHK